MSQVDHVRVEISVILGRCTLPMKQLLRMGRGAVIPLETGEDDELWVLANNYPIARGSVEVQGEKVAITLTDVADVHEFYAGG